MVAKFAMKVWQDAQEEEETKKNDRAVVFDDKSLGSIYLSIPCMCCNYCCFNSGQLHICFLPVVFVLPLLLLLLLSWH